MHKPSTRNLWLKTSPLIGALLLAVAACSSEGASSPQPSWSPASFPTVDASGVVFPKGPHDVTINIVASNSTLSGEGYIDVSGDGKCALDIAMKETYKDTGESKTYQVTKSLAGPAYISEDGQQWTDTRDPNSPVSPLFTLVNPIGISLSGSTQYQSLCFVSAFPALTSPQLSTGEFPWDPVGIDAFVEASNQSFVAEVLRLAGASAEEFNRVATAVVELAGLPSSEFANSASLVKVTEKSDSTSISYFFGIEQSVKVDITLTPTTEKTISPPPNAVSWEDELMSFSDSSGVPGVLERYFAVS